MIFLAERLLLRDPAQPGKNKNRIYNSAEAKAQSCQALDRAAAGQVFPFVKQDSKVA